MYDIADLYKAEVTIPTAFAVAAEQPEDRYRYEAQGSDAIVKQSILERAVRDSWLLQMIAMPTNRGCASSFMDEEKACSQCRIIWKRS